MILGSSHQDAITILNNRASKLIFMKQNLTELHKESHVFTTIVGNSSTLSIINRSRQKISKYMENMNNTFNESDLSDIYRLLQQTTAVYTCTSRTYAIVTKINHMLNSKKRLSVHLKDLKSYWLCSFSILSRIKVEIKSGTMCGKFPDNWKLRKILLNNLWVKTKIIWEIRKYSELN